MHLQMWKSLSEETTNFELCPLFIAARFVLVEHIQQACSSLPRFHQVKMIIVQHELLNFDSNIIYILCIMFIV